MKPNDQPLGTEREFFAQNRDQWRAAHPGKFVLVKGDRLIGTFNRPEDAIGEGARLFGTDSFLVRSVDQSEEELYIPALALGILNANSPRSV